MVTGGFVHFGQSWWLDIWTWYSITGHVKNVSRGPSGDVCLFGCLGVRSCPATIESKDELADAINFTASGTLYPILRLAS